MENTHNFILPKKNLIGTGSIKDLPNELLSWKLSKVLIVTDKNMISLGYVENVEKILKSLFISYDIFDGILHPNPTVSFVEDGLTYLNKGLNVFKRNYNLLISIGGGTNHDCAKAIATVATNGGSIIDYEGYNKITKLGIPQIAINTTAGSGAELTMYSIIVDESRKVKMVISSPFLTPFISVNDPIFMTTMPKEVTASSGIDVVSHAIEAYVSTEASPITDSLALEALKLVFEYLPRSYDNGNDLEAREKMMFANIMAGMAFNNAGLGYVHCMAHQLGGFYQQSHGDYNAVLLPYVFEFNSVSIPEQRILKLCEAMGTITHNRSQAVDLIIDSVDKLRSKLEIPSKLSEMGLKESDIETLSQNALKDICFFTNPRQGLLEDIISLYKAAF
ncbi:iron-containing alcohol dehydrogenase [Desulfosporosinus nitroreducens]|uniref:Iron-containing alcohol dehydrogenase n=1 Tax=Desulfosporosinus nitroreducens TaxID=2018668 RepID=A0ABT8QPF0_9FIRM|nr:iron-containing alcohol dehydrogenase [Desulfosporosinus nitroreducens]MCO1603384.1 iron-containing alcohol dehydrogenase [Desulfosporosinus nitroreducens]MDO0823224.1 iron-containing alcohol dehydrogenase [Desulfosporosinus nitroreducens]